MKNYKKIILNNGIPLYLYSDPSLKQVFFNYIVKYGSSGEWFNFSLDGKEHNLESGYAHFLEHLLEEHSKYGNLYKSLDEKGFNANAYTSTDHTSFYFYGTKDIKDSIKKTIEAIEMPIYKSKDVEHSRYAIAEEAATMSGDINLAAVLLAEKNLFKDFDLYDDTLCCIGDRETTENITKDELDACYKAFYTDDRKVLVVAGNIDEIELVNYLNNIYKNIPEHKSNLILPDINYDPIREKETILESNIELDFDALAIKIKKPIDIDMKDLKLAVNVLSGYVLQQNDFLDELKNKGIIDSLYSCFIENVGDYVSISQGIISSKPEEYIKRLLDKINKKDLSKEDFELIKKTLIANEICNLESKYYPPSQFGSKMHYTDDYSDLDSYKKLDYEKCKDIIGQLDFNNYTKVKVKRI